MNPKEVAVVVPVVPSGLVKNVPVIADIRGTPGLDQTVKSVAVEPTMVALTGDQNVLAGLVTVYTQPVDISGATDQVVEERGPGPAPGRVPGHPGTGDNYCDGGAGRCSNRSAAVSSSDLPATGPSGAYPDGRRSGWQVFGLRPCFWP